MYRLGDNSEAHFDPDTNWVKVYHKRPWSKGKKLWALALELQLQELRDFLAWAEAQSNSKGDLA